MPFASVQEALEEIRAGRMLVVVDDEDRENEGDLTIAAEKVTPEIINFMATHGRGLICLALTAGALRLPAPAADDPDQHLRISAPLSANRSMRATASPPAFPPPTAPARSSRPSIPTAGRPIWRAPATCFRCAPAKAACWCAPGRRRLRRPRAPRRARARRRDLRNHERGRHDGARAAAHEFCRAHGLKMISVAELIRYRLKHEQFIRRAAEGCIDTEFGEFRTIAYTSDINPESHLALVRGDVAGKENVLVRMHSHCVYGDVFGATTAIAAAWSAAPCGRSPTRAAACWSISTRPAPASASNATAGEPPDGLPRPRFHALPGEAGQRQLQHETGSAPRS